MAGSFGFGQSVGFDDFERGVVFEPLLQIGHFGGGPLPVLFSKTGIGVSSAKLAGLVYSVEMDFLS